MKLIFLLLLFINSICYGQRITTLPGDCVKIQNGTCIDKDELGYLDGVTSSIQTQLTGKVSDTAYNASSWDGVTTVAPSKNATRDKFESVATDISAKADGAASSVDSEVALFSSTTGKVLKRASATGVAKLASGVLSASNVNLASEVTGTLPVGNGGTGITSPGTSGNIMISNGTAWVSSAFPSAGLPAISTKTSAYTILNSDYTILANASGGAFNITAPTSPGTGQIHVLKKIGTDFNVVTFVGSYEGGSNTTLNTGGETLTIQYDGTTWRKLHRDTHARGTYTPTFTGLTIGSVNDFFWKREGEELCSYGYGTQTATAASLGTINFPSASWEVNHSVYGASYTKQVGTWLGAINTTGTTTPAATRGPWIVTTETTLTNTLSLQSVVDRDGFASNAIIAKENMSSVMTSGTAFHIEFCVAITGWNE